MSTPEREGLAAYLQNLFSAETVYPDFSWKLNNYAYYLKGSAKIKDGLDVLLTAIELDFSNQFRDKIN